MKLCPNCRKAMHASEITWYCNCPFCGFEIGEFMDRRTNPRHRGLYKSTITAQDTSYTGYTLDISSRGARIVYKGRIPDKGKVLHLQVKELSTEGMVEVVWSKKVSEGMVHVGLKLMKQENALNVV